MHGDAAVISEDGRVAQGTQHYFSLARMGTGFNKGTHEWKFRVRQHNVGSRDVTLFARPAQLEGGTFFAYFGLVDGDFEPVGRQYSGAHSWVLYTPGSGRLSYANGALTGSFSCNCENCRSMAYGIRDVFMRSVHFCVCICICTEILHSVFCASGVGCGG